MSSEHTERTHTRLSPSGAHRWMTCTPSAVLEAQFPDSQSEYAAEGTLAHELCEIKLTAYAVTPTGKKTLDARIKKLKGDPLWKDEMLGHADTYLDYIKGDMLAMCEKPHVVVEKRVDLGQWVPGCSGIADCILIGCNELHIIDFKYGMGVPVSARQNPQLMLYALGAYALYGMLYPVERIKLTIVQPRLSNEASEYELTLEELLAFGELVKEKAALALEGKGDYTPSAEACRFCKARQTCRARADHNVKLAFAKKDGTAVVDCKPPTLTPDEIGQYLNWGGDVAKWLSDLKDYALSETLLGHTITGWKAVEGRSVREWTDQEKAFDALVEAAIPASVLYETVPLTLAKVEKVVGKTTFNDLVGEYVVKKPGRPTLVPESDKRAAVTNVTKAADVFK